MNQEADSTAAWPQAALAQDQGRFPYLLLDLISYKIRGSKSLALSARFSSAYFLESVDSTDLIMYCAEQRCYRYAQGSSHP